MLICFLHRSILMIMHKVSLEISNSETSHNLKGWPFYTWKDWCFSFSSQSPSLLQDRMGETDIRKICFQVGGFCSTGDEKVKVNVSKQTLYLKNSCWGWTFFLQIVPGSLRRLNDAKMRDGNLVETLHWAQLLDFTWRGLQQFSHTFTFILSFGSSHKKCYLNKAVKYVGSIHKVFCHPLMHDKRNVQ